MTLKPVTTEKAVKIIELDNTLTFETPRTLKKEQIKIEVEKMFSVKVLKVRTLIKHNNKFAYVHIAKETPAIDIATKLGMI